MELNSEEESDSGPDDSIAPVPIEEYESRRKSGHEVKVGGIEIAKAQQRIEARDKADRRKERERVQREHKQRRLKRRGSREGGDGDQGVALLADESPPGEESGGEEGEREGLASDGEVGERVDSRPVGVAKKGKRKKGEEKKQLQNDEELAKYLLRM